MDTLQEAHDRYYHYCATGFPVGYWRTKQFADDYFRITGTVFIDPTFPWWRRLLMRIGARRGK